MKYAIISDIHGNYIALQAVIDDIEKNNVDKIICLGDVLTLGLQPLEVLEVIRNLDCTFILGNHESALLDLDNALNFKIAPVVISVLEWCLSKLSKNDLDFLQSFRDSHIINLGNKTELLCFHGSPSSNVDIITSTTEDSEVYQHFAKLKPKYFAGGHTHLQMLRQFEGRLIINPGSVGMPFTKIPGPGQAPIILPFAEYAILNSDGENLSVDLKRVETDITKINRVIYNSDIPMKEWWQKQFKNF